MGWKYNTMSDSPVEYKGVTYANQAELDKSTASRKTASSSGGSNSSNGNSNSGSSNNRYLGSDGKYYQTGGSGKEFVYNPSTGNIGVSRPDGSYAYYEKGSAGYDNAMQAMRNDGVSFGGVLSGSSDNSGNSSQPWAGGGFGEGVLGGSTVQENSIVQQYEEKLADYEAQLEAARKANDAALAAAIEAAIARLNEQKPEILRNYEQANTDAYNSYMQAVNPYGGLAEANAAIGLGNSGYQESSLVDLGNTYQNAMNANEQTKADLLNQLEAAKREAQLSGDIERANAASQYAQMIAQNSMTGASAILNYQQQQQQALQDAAYRAWQMEQAEKQWDYGVEQDARQEALAKAQLLAGYGDFSGYAALGYDTSAMQRAWQAANAQKATSRNGGRKRSVTGDTGKKLSDSSGEWDGIDLQSVLDLGYGPLSQEELNRKLAAGEIGYTIQNGKLYFEKKPQSQTGYNILPQFTGAPTKDTIMQHLKEKGYI